MKASITIHLDDGKEVTLTMDQAIELRDKLNRLAQSKEPAPFYVPPIPQPMYNPVKWAEPTSWPPKDWPPGTIISSDQKGV